MTTTKTIAELDIRDAMMRGFLAQLSDDDMDTLAIMMASERRNRRRKAAEPVKAIKAAEPVKAIKAAEPVKAATFDEETVVLARRGKIVFTKSGCKLSSRQRAGIRNSALEMGGHTVAVDDDKIRPALYEEFNDKYMTILQFDTVKAAKAFMVNQSEYFTNRK